jgi:methanogenic corrinoid protein MtbC1
MAFLRVKAVRGRPYAYLVENRWDAARKQSRQRVVLYLGRLDRLGPGSIPSEYRTPTVVRALERRVAEEGGRRGTISDGIRQELREALLSADRTRVRRVARSAIRELGAAAFLSGVLADVMREIGLEWSSGSLSISDEHLATGMAASLLSELNASARPRSTGGPEVVLCVPEGEEHALALQVAEALLLAKGYRPVNLGASAPSRSIAEFVRARRPAGVLISVSHAGRLEAARSLARELRKDLPMLRVAIGGRGVEASGPRRGMPGVDLVAGPMAEYLEGWPSAAPAGR